MFITHKNIKEKDESWTKVELNMFTQNKDYISSSRVQKNRIKEKDNIENELKTLILYLLSKKIFKKDEN